MSKEFEQISLKPGFMKHNGGVLFRNISEREYEFKSTIKDNHLNTVLRNSKHLLELINNILDLSKIEAEKLEIEQQECDLVQLIEDINSVINVLANSKNLEFKIDYAFPLPKTIKSDITRLKQVLLNICTNEPFCSVRNLSIVIRLVNNVIICSIVRFLLFI